MTKNDFLTTVMKKKIEELISKLSQEEIEKVFCEVLEDSSKSKKY